MFQPVATKQRWPMASDNYQRQLTTLVLVLDLRQLPTATDNVGSGTRPKHPSVPEFRWVPLFMLYSKLKGGFLPRYGEWTIFNIFVMLYPPLIKNTPKCSSSYKVFFPYSLDKVVSYESFCARVVRPFMACHTRHGR
jgi:hypothetical protein